MIMLEFYVLNSRAAIGLRVCQVCVFLCLVGRICFSPAKVNGSRIWTFKVMGHGVAFGQKDMSKIDVEMCLCVT